ncbi:MAG TPA: DUF4199 domain-containing protein [Candidatus Kapabacteria bacterium]|jgi:uncharacterized membrane protein YhfC|nr:DUF4199 domain-containing protein [Candidatus Kapabacteria bacterium]
MVTTILFGVYSAAIAIAITLIEYFTGLDKTGTANWLGYVALPFLILFLWLAMNERKQEDFGGTITYGQCVGTGALIGLWAGIVTAIFMYVYFTAINPGMIDFMSQKQLAAMQSRQMNPAQMEKAVSMMKQWFIPIAVGGSIIGDVFFATLFSLILGIFVRTKEESDGIKAV